MQTVLFFCRCMLEVLLVFHYLLHYFNLMTLIIDKLSSWNAAKWVSLWAEAWGSPCSCSILNKQYAFWTISDISVWVCRKCPVIWVEQWRFTCDESCVSPKVIKLFCRLWNGWWLSKEIWAKLLQSASKPPASFAPEM